MGHSVPNNNNVSKENVIHVAEGNTFKFTRGMFALLQDPKKVPSHGGVPFVMVLKKLRSGLYGRNRALIPEFKIRQGLAIFLPDHGLDVGAEFVFVWTADHSAAAVPLREREAYLAEYEPEIKTAETS